MRSPARQPRQETAASTPPDNDRVATRTATGYPPLDTFTEPQRAVLRALAKMAGAKP